MRDVATVLVLSGWVLAAGPVLADGAGTNTNASPIQVYGGVLAPGETDGYPFASPFAPLCTGGFQLAGNGAMVNLLVLNGALGDVVLLHTRDPGDPDWAPTTTAATGAPLRAAAATADPVRWCPFFSVEVAAAPGPLAYSVVTCSALAGPCPALWP